MKHIIGIGLLALGAAFSPPGTWAQDPPEVIQEAPDRAPEVMYGEVVDRVYAPSIHSWAALDSQRFILYVTPFRPYLVTLDRKVNSLRWDDRIALDNRTNYLHSRFDRVYVDGFPYSISRIEKLSRETAKALLRKDKDQPVETDKEADDEELEAAAGP